MSADGVYDALCGPCMRQVVMLAGHAAARGGLRCTLRCAADDHVSSWQTRCVFMVDCGTGRLINIFGAVGVISGR